MEYHADISKDLSADELALLDASKELWETRTVPAKSLLITQGEQAHSLFYVAKGCLRLYTLDDGKEVTVQFFFEGDFIVPFESIYKNQPSIYTLEAIEASEVWAMHKDCFFAQLDKRPRLHPSLRETACQALLHVVRPLPLAHQIHATAALRGAAEPTPRGVAPCAATLYRLIPRHHACLAQPHPKSPLTRPHFFTFVIVHIGLHRLSLQPEKPML